MERPDEHLLARARLVGELALLASLLRAVASRDEVTTEATTARLRRLDDAVHHEGQARRLRIVPAGPIAHAPLERDPTEPSPSAGRPAAAAPASDDRGDKEPVPQIGAAGRATPPVGEADGADPDDDATDVIDVIDVGDGDGDGGTEAAERTESGRGESGRGEPGRGEPEERVASTDDDTSESDTAESDSRSDNAESDSGSGEGSGEDTRLSG